MAKDFIFEADHQVSLGETDAAGVLFYAEAFAIAHRIYEQMLSAGGLSIGQILRGGELGLPIIQAEASYSGPIFTSDSLKIGIMVESISTTSFILEYAFLKKGGLCAQVRTVHVCIDAASRSKRELPPNLLKILTP